MLWAAHVSKRRRRDPRPVLLTIGERWGNVPPAISACKRYKLDWEAMGSLALHNTSISVWVGGWGWVGWGVEWGVGGWVGGWLPGQDARGQEGGAKAHVRMPAIMWARSSNLCCRKGNPNGATGSEEAASS